MRRGCVVGKFWPPHAGHQFLIDEALLECDELHLIVIGRPEERPLPAVRAGWLRGLYPAVRVYETVDDIPNESPPWAERTVEVLGFTPDVVFTSETYGETWAAAMQCEHTLIDLHRRQYPVSGSEVRDYPIEYWHRLSAPVRRYYARRVVLIGAESTGKTTLAEELAGSYDTLWVPEWARLYGAARSFGSEDWEVDVALFDLIELNQPLLESAMAEQCNGILICDTDLLATLIWHEAYRPDATEERARIAAAHARHRATYETALYLLAVDDTPWVQDGTRNRGEQSGHGSRPWFTQRFREELAARGETVIELKGDWEQRLETAQAAVAALAETRDQLAGLAPRLGTTL
ncbi:MAG: AAA family ATPase [Acidimicrobiales bacterium]|nr:AAA family ATPase [Acidimicrobiales bacterium]